MLGDFKVVFGGQTKDSPLTAPVIQTKETEVQSQKVEKEALSKISQELDENDLALMQIQDPHRYEQLMIEREIEDDGPRSAGLDEHEQSIADEQLAKLGPGTQTAHNH